MGEAKRDGLRRDLTRKRGSGPIVSSVIFFVDYYVPGRKTGLAELATERETEKDWATTRKSALVSLTHPDHDQNKGMGTGRLGPWNSSRRWPVARSWPAAHWSAWEGVLEEKPRQGKEQGVAMGPTNLDVTADAAHSVCLSVCPSAHFILGGHSVPEREQLESRTGKNWHRAELSIPTGSASGRLGLWGSGLGLPGLILLVTGH